MLEGLLGPQYDQFRPDGSVTRRMRAHQIRKRRDLRVAQSRQRESARVTSQLVKSDLSQDDLSDLDYLVERPFSTTDNVFDAIIPLDVSESYLNDFDSFTNTTGNESLGCSMSAPEPLFSFSADTTAKDSPHFPPLEKIDIPLMPTFETDEASMLKADALRPINSSMIERSSDYGALAAPDTTSLSLLPGGNLLGGDSRIPSLDPQDLSGVGAENDSFPENAASNANPVLDFGISDDSAAPKKGGMISRTSSHQFPSDTPSNTHTRSTISNQRTRESDLSCLINRLSKCSLGEKAFVKDLLKHFSTSTLSSLRSSIYSRFSMPTIRTAKNSLVIQSEPFVSTSSAKRASRLLELPGGFITSNVNTFPRHLACTSEESFLVRPTYCEGCFSRHMTRLEKQRFSIPFALIQHKREIPVEQIWSNRSVPWVDRFGNTALHIAAALGATYQEIRDIIHKGVSVHQTNTAGQTFMHVINFRRFEIFEMVRLRKHLQLQKFDFHRPDVLGKTFLASLDFGLNTVDFIKCWLTPFIHWNLSKQYVTNYDSLKHMFEDSGGSENQWLSLGWDRWVRSLPSKTELANFHLSIREHTTTSFVNELLLCSKERLVPYKNFEATNGGNFMNI